MDVTGGMAIGVASSTVAEKVTDIGKDEEILKYLRRLDEYVQEKRQSKTIVPLFLSTDGAGARLSQIKFTPTGRFYIKEQWWHASTDGWCTFVIGSSTYPSRFDSGAFPNHVPHVILGGSEISLDAVTIGAPVLNLSLWVYLVGQYEEKAG